MTKHSVRTFGEDTETLERISHTWGPGSLSNGTFHLDMRQPVVGDQESVEDITAPPVFFLKSYPLKFSPHILLIVSSNEASFDLCISSHFSASYLFFFFLFHVHFPAHSSSSPVTLHPRLFSI